MSYETLKIIIAILGPVVIYTTVFSMVRAPELIAAMPAAARHMLEVIGAIIIVGAWFYIGSLGGAMALLGLLLLVTPTVARYVSRPSLTSRGSAHQRSLARPDDDRSARLM